MKCIDCICCNKKDMKCHPKSLDCKNEYDLTEEDLYKDRDCDFFKIKDEYYYLIVDKKHTLIYIKTKLNITDFTNESMFIKELMKLKGKNINNVNNYKIYEITKNEYYTKSV